MLLHQKQNKTVFGIVFALGGSTKRLNKKQEHYMKKLVLIGITVGLASLAHATSITILNTTNSGSISGQSSYVYLEQIAKGTDISSASLYFNLTLTASGSLPNVVFSDLINAPNKNGVFADRSGGFSTAETGTDYFQNNSSYSSYADSLSTSAAFTTGQHLSWTYNFTGSTAGTSLYDLHQDVFNNGFFDIGIDPNCTYVGSIVLNYTISSGNNQGSVPDQATTAGLLGISMLGLGAFRRKFVTAKNQA